MTRKTPQTKEYHDAYNWGHRCVGARQCEAEDCENKCLGKLCGPCFDKGLRELARAGVGYRKWVARHDAYVRSLNAASVRGCGSNKEWGE